MHYCAKAYLCGLLTISSAVVHSMQPGGETTFTGPLNRNAFSHPAANLTADQRLDFKVGRGFFRRLWVTAPASTQAADGLGPLYDARGCMNCHPNNGRGHPPDGPLDNAVSMFLRVDIPPQNNAQHQQLAERRVTNIPEPTYGLQLQGFAVAGHKAEARMQIDYGEVPVILADGSEVSLRRPMYRVDDLGYGPLHPQARLSARVAPQMIGLGLLEAIDEEDIVNRADPDDRDGDGVSGRANRVWSHELQNVALGRFGHKAGMPSVNEQSQAAFSADLGLSVPLFRDPSGDCTVRQADCRAAPNGNSPQYEDLEAHRQVTDLVRLYVSHIAVPARRNGEDPDVLAGEGVFERIGCGACHVPRFRTGTRTAAVAMHNQDIAPYTDLLLHDMGEGLADNRPEGVASGREWRTAPLWGVGLAPLVSAHSNFLHDGRARNLLEAILWHGGEARAQRDAVIALDRTSREQLLKFIESL